MIVAGAFALAATSCTSAPSDALAFADSEPGTTTTFVVAADEPVPLVTFHADWLCELQRRNFPDLSSIETALDESLTANGLGRVAYDEFVAELAESEEMRDQVLSRFQQRCQA